LKLFIQQKYRGDKHYVWCGENFDSTKVSHYSTTARAAPSSDPSAIYAQLKRAITYSDAHCDKIVSQRNSIIKLAKGWAAKGEISEQDLKDITFNAKHASLNDWRPLIYVIPREKVEPRLVPVPADKRASLGNEFILRDLSADEFDIIEL